MEKRRITVTVLMVLCACCAFGIPKKSEQKAEFISGRMAAEFKLTEEQKTAVKNALIKNDEGWAAAFALRKSGDADGFEDAKKKLAATLRARLVEATGAEADGSALMKRYNELRKEFIGNQ
jgi:hypothetical protein